MSKTETSPDLAKQLTEDERVADEMIANNVKKDERLRERRRELIYFLGEAEELRKKYQKLSASSPENKMLLEKSTELGKNIADKKRELEILDEESRKLTGSRNKGKVTGEVIDPETGKTTYLVTESITDVGDDLTFDAIHEEANKIEEDIEIKKKEKERENLRSGLREQIEFLINELQEDIHTSADIDAVLKLFNDQKGERKLNLPKYEYALSLTAHKEEALKRAEVSQMLSDCGLDKIKISEIFPEYKVDNSVDTLCEKIQREDDGLEKFLDYLRSIKESFGRWKSFTKSGHLKTIDRILANETMLQEWQTVLKRAQAKEMTANRMKSKEETRKEEEEYLKYIEPFFQERFYQPLLNWLKENNKKNLPINNNPKDYIEGIWSRIERLFSHVLEFKSEISEKFADEQAKRLLDEFQQYQQSLEKK